MADIKKAIWLSYDLGIGGDFPGLYKWLDNHKAVECGSSVAFFDYLIDSEKLDVIFKVLADDIKGSVHLRSGDRLYAVYRKTEDDSKSSVRGNFIYGRRKSNPWDGYGDNEPLEGDDSE